MMDGSDDADRKLDDASAAVITSSISERKTTEMETNGKEGLDLLFYWWRLWSRVIAPPSRKRIPFSFSFSFLFFFFLFFYREIIIIFKKVRNEICICIPFILLRVTLKLRLYR
jgi:hypothetical protein